MDISTVTNTAPLAAPATATTTSTASVPSTSSSSTSANSIAAAQASPAVRLQSLVNSAESVLFASLGSGGSALPDLSGLTAAAQAYSLYTNPGLLQELASSGSQLGTTVDATA